MKNMLEVYQMNAEEDFRACAWVLSVTVLLKAMKLLNLGKLVG